MNPISLLGALGLLKFFFDKIAVTSMLRALKVMRMVLLDTADQTSAGDRQRMLVEIGTKLGAYLDNQTAKEAKVNVAYKVGKLAHQAYQYFVPGFVRTVLFIPTYIITYPFAWFLDRNRMDAIRNQTRELAIKGLWSFCIPLSLGYLAACLLVDEVEYVKVVRGQDPDDPELLQKTIKRIVVGPGPFSFQLPYHPLLKLACQLTIGFAVFHTVSFLLILANCAEIEGTQLPSSRR